MEKETKLETYRVDMVCDNCNEGTMRYQADTVQAFFTYPKFEHRCDHCGARRLYDIIYPQLRYKTL